MLRAFIHSNRAAAERWTKRYPAFFDCPSYHAELDERIRLELEAGAASVLEPGGIDRPMLCKGQHFLYDGLDVEDQPACHEIYDHFWVQSIEKSISTLR